MRFESNASFPEGQLVMAMIYGRAVSLSWCFCIRDRRRVEG